MLVLGPPVRVECVAVAVHLPKLSLELPMVPVSVVMWVLELAPVMVLGAQPLLGLLQPGFLRWTVRSGVL